MSSIPEILSALPLVPWPTAFALVGSLMTVTFGIIKMIGMLRQKLPKDFTQEISGLRKDMKDIDRSVSTLHTSVHSKNIHVEVLGKQVDDLKSTNAQFHVKLEKITDLIIKYLSEQR